MYYSFVPDLIKGDLDSIRPHVQTFYSDLVSYPSSIIAFFLCLLLSAQDTDYVFEQNVPTIKDTDQYATDLMKCVDAVRELEKRSPSLPEVSPPDFNDSLSALNFITHSTRFSSLAASRGDSTKLSTRSPTSTNCASPARTSSLSPTTRSGGSSPRARTASV